MKELLSIVTGVDGTTHKDRGRPCRGCTGVVNGCGLARCWILILQLGSQLQPPAVLVLSHYYTVRL